MDVLFIHRRAEARPRTGPDAYASDCFACAICTLKYDLVVLGHAAFLWCSDNFLVNGMRIAVLVAALLLIMH